MLAGIVEQRCVLAVAFLDDLLEGLAFKTAAGKKLVALGDIGLVVFVVVKLKRLGGHVRGQRVISVWQVRQFKRHDKLLR